MLERMLTRHAATRMQQRGIGSTEVTCLLDFGREVHDRHGGIVVVFGRHARRAAHRAGVPAPALDRLARLYLVEVGGGIATVGHRTRRFRRG